MRKISIFSVILMATLSCGALFTSCASGKEDLSKDEPGKQEEKKQEEEKKEEGEVRKDIFGEDFFIKITDEKSGVVSYILDNDKIGKYHTQSNYFNTRSMTDDERFLFFFVSTDEYNKPAKEEKQEGMVLDLKYGKLYPMPECRFSCCPCIDTKTDIMYYGAYTYQANGEANKREAAFYKRELLVDPGKAIKLCPFPMTQIDSSFASSKYAPIKRICSHVYLTSDRKKALLDTRLNNEFYVGMVDLATGTWEKWDHTGKNEVNDPDCRQDIELTHGQICPTNDNWVLCAGTDYSEAYPNSSVKHPMALDPDGIFPRLQLLEKKDGKVTRTTIEPDMRCVVSDQPENYATHERWDESGQSIYWCSRGIHLRNLVTGEYKVVFDYAKHYNDGIYKEKPAHCFFSRNNEYVTYDDNQPDFYRGGRWRVSFYNTLTDKVVRIHSEIPAIAPSKAEESSLHPDPHPQFVCNDKYIVSTRSTVNGNKKQMHICITPVDQLIEKTK